MPYKHKAKVGRNGGATGVCHKKKQLKVPLHNKNFRKNWPGPLQKMCMRKGAPTRVF